MSVMLITTFLMSLVMLMVWRLPPWLPALFLAVFGFIEAIYLSSTLYKIANGAWFPVLLSGLLLVIMYAWYYGSSRKSLFDQKNMVNAQGLTVSARAESRGPLCVPRGLRDRRCGSHKRVRRKMLRFGNQGCISLWLRTGATPSILTRTGFQVRCRLREVQGML